jgi:DNA-binding NarL/FixJ family response regulator
MDSLGELLLTDFSRTGQTVPTVLIVDGDDAFRRQLRTLFERCGGFNPCMEAANGVEALDMTKRLLPELAVLDFSLPDTSGFELAQKLRAVGPELQVFILATDCSVDIEKSAQSFGITAVFSKLDDLPTLVANARAVCGIE